LPNRKTRNIKAYDVAVNNNDVAAIAALYTEDALFESDRGPVYGRKAIEKWYADVFQEWHPKNHIGSRYRQEGCLDIRDD
jgi:ketosteroid isomerase-like protein